MSCTLWVQRKYNPLQTYWKSEANRFIFAELLNCVPDVNNLICSKTAKIKEFASLYVSYAVFKESQFKSIQVDMVAWFIQTGSYKTSLK